MGAPVGKWFEDLAKAEGSFDVQVADLAEIALPFLDEAAHPAAKQYEHAHTKEWAARIDASNAVVFIMPEYNHSFPAAAKNAVDYLNQEWRNKAVGFVSYGGISAGTRSVEAFVPVVTFLGMISAATAVNIPMPWGMVDDNGHFNPPAVSAEAAHQLLGELKAIAAKFA
jgi:NAD(P)H-dependent FMN reductase